MTWLTCHVMMGHDIVCTMGALIYMYMYILYIYIYTHQADQVLVEVLLAMNILDTLKTRRYEFISRNAQTSNKA